MRERAAATIFMWIAQAVSISLILNSLRYTEWIPSPVNPSEMIGQTAFVSEQWQLGAAILIFVLILGAVGGTVAIWESASGKSEHQSQRQTEKAKRDNRDARIKRLLLTMDDDDLDALEQGRLGEDGERLSLESLLKRRD